MSILINKTSSYTKRKCVKRSKLVCSFKDGFIIPPNKLIPLKLINITKKVKKKK